MQKVINLPFDGKGKTPQEAAELISKELGKVHGTEVKFVIPGFWSWREHWHVLMTLLTDILNQNNSEFNFVPCCSKTELSIMGLRVV